MMSMQITSEKKIDFCLSNQYDSLLDQSLGFLPIKLYYSFCKYDSLTAITESSGRVYSYRELVNNIDLLYAGINVKFSLSVKTIAITGKLDHNLISSIIAAWLANATVVLIDPDLPLLRRKKIIQLTSPDFILGHDFDGYEGYECYHYNQLKAEDKGIKNYVVDVDWQQKPAYFVFTSGSTGEPKGIIGSHLGLSHFINWITKEFNFTQQDRCAQFTSLGFDVIYRAIFAPLLSGAQLFISPYPVYDGESIINWLFSNQITLFNTVPAIINSWLQQIEVRSLPELRLIFSAGEKLSGKLLGLIYDKLTFAGKVINLYGPSETTLAKCYYTVEKSDCEKIYLPIGKPIPNTECYILSDSGELITEPDIEGELLIRTPYRSFGYLNAANNNFIPLSAEKNERDLIYKTGDLAYFDHYGNIVISGRKDNQVKINGIRIELEEIESVIASVDGVREVAVVFYNSGLFAVIAGKEDLDLHTRILNKLQISLPTYMHPSVIQFIATLPKNANGKIDRQVVIKFFQSEKLTEVVSEEEGQLLQICRRVLNQENIALCHSLIKFGLNSLLAMLIITKIKQQFSVTITLGELYSAENIAVIMQLIQNKIKSSSSNIIPIVSSNQQLYPATPVQKRLFSLSQADTGRDVYNIISAFEINGNFNQERFIRALKIVFNHYKIFHTSFIIQEGKLFQKLTQVNDLPLKLTNIDELMLSKEIDQLNICFDLGSAPLIRFGLFQITDKRYLFAYNVHHIIFDGKSHQQFLNDIWANYFANIMPASKIHYTDYSLYLNQQEKFSNIKLETYWLNEFASEVPIINLPYDFSRPLLKEYRGGLLKKNLPHEQLNLIRQYAKTEGISVFNLLLGAFGILLFRYSSQDDMVIGVPVLGRNHPDIQEIPGMFVETIPLRLGLDKNLTIIDFLTNLQKKIINGIENQCQLDELINSLKIKRDAGRNPLFDVMFAYWEGATTKFNVDDIDIKPLHYHNRTAKFDLMGYIDENPDEVSISFEYDLNLFRAETVERMLDNFLYIVDELLKCDSQHTKLQQIYGVNLQENEYLLDISYTSFDLPDGKFFLDYFVQQCQKLPDKIAVSDGQNYLSYSELDALSNGLAKHLYLSGIRVGSKVPILLERSINMLVAILGVLKVGACYVPLDVSYPDERLLYVLNDSDAVSIITQHSLINKIKTLKGNEITIVTVEEVSATSSVNYYLNPKPEDIFVLFYTSGTTGVPKGVMQTQLGLINFALYENQENQLSTDDRVAFYSSFGFDVSMWSLLLPLVCGATSYIIPEEIRLSIAEINDFIEKNNISVALFPTQMCESFMHFTNNKSLRLVWTAGEKLNRYRDCGYRLINGYGPTEYTGCTTRYEVSQLVSNIPIGRPLGNTWIYIVDDDLQLKPLGAVGELCVAGAQIAAGYLNKEQETRLKFVPNPYANCDFNKIIYRTGDLARWLPDGNLEYHGRLDNQIKIRGFRVELDEIEQALGYFSEINEAAVIHKNDESGKKYLLAFFTAQSIINKDNLRSQLRSKLPDYMIPSIMEQLEVMPFNANGKIDKKALAKIEVTKKNTEFSALETELERQVAEVWQNTLKLERVSREDDFFELGGDSILAIIMGASLNKVLNKKISIKMLFIHSRLYDFATYIATLKEVEPLNSISMVPDYDNLYEPFPLTDVQKAYLVGRENLFELGGVATHVYREDSFKSLNILHLEMALNQLIRRHPVLRCVFNLNGTQKFIETVPEYKIKVQDLRNFSLNEKEELLQVWRTELAQQIFDINQYPLFEFRVSRFNDRDILHFSFDALIMDAQSMRIFMQEMTQLYQNPQLVFEPLLLTFRDYIVAYQQLKLSERYFEDKLYWQKRIPDLPFGPELITIKHPSQIKTPVFARKTRKIPSELWQTLRQKIQQAKISPTVPFLALYGQVLAHWSANKRFLINLTLFSREAFHSDVEKILGDFTILELFEYSGYTKDSFMSLFRQVQDQLWDDLGHTLYSALEVQAELHRLYDTGMDKLIAPVVLTSLLGIKHNDDKFLSADYLGRTFAITQTSQVWLDNKIYEKDGDLIIEWDYVKELFEDIMLEEMIDCYFSFITQIAISDWEYKPEFKISERDLSLIKQVNTTFNSAVLPTTTLIGSFIASAKSFPKNIAVIDINGSYTYQDLNDKVGYFTNLLVSRGIKRGDLVIIYAEKGINQVAGLLGIMAAGAAYIPINIDWPFSRLIDIALIAGVNDIVITSSQLTKLTEAGHALSNFRLHLLDGNKRHQFMVNEELEVSVDKEDLAYIIFTSGSTGKPKGVRITHHGAMNTINDINLRFNVCKEDRSFAISNISFDLSVYDIFGLLAVGGTVVIPSDGMINQPEDLTTFMLFHQVTIYNSVPALMSIILQSIQNKLEKQVLRLILLSGDFIPLNLPQALKNKFLNVKIISLGGATEGSIWSIIYPIEEIQSEWSSIPYGKPMYNQNIWIKDENLNLCPINVPGEICIGGLGVAHGYLGDIDKTKKHFILNKEGLRVYRTGDLGVMHRDGNFEILGRIDQQVKINGFRVELGEIEAALATINSIKSFVVRIIEHSKTNKELIAYVVPYVYDTLEFKLAKYGIRKLKIESTQQLAKLVISEEAQKDAAKYAFERKSYRSFAGRFDDRSELEKLLVEPISLTNQKYSDNIDNQMIIAFLSRLLVPFKAFSSDDGVLDKYRYPSAGGLYPVRIYLLLSSEYGTHAGYYYYNPVEHQLYLCSEISNRQLPPSGITILFNGYTPAIVPYYHERSDDYMKLETGYMYYLLQNRIPGWVISPVPDGIPDIESETSLLCATYSPEVKVSILKMPTPAILLFNLGSKFECYQNVGEGFKFIKTIEKQFKFGQMGDNLRILNESGAVLLLGGNNFIDIGVWTQAICEKLLDFRIGTCLFGVFDVGQELAKIIFQQHFSTAIVFGKVTLETIQAKASMTGNNDGEYNSFIGLVMENLKSKLPEYMLPKHILKLRELPLTINGKVSIKDLPIPDGKINLTDLIAPRDKTEEDILELWKETLGISNNIIGIENDFFKNGGDSLKAIMLAVKISKLYLRKIPATFIYKNRTVTEQAAKIFEYLLAPTEDYVNLNDLELENILILFPPFNSGAEAYHDLSGRLDKVTVIGVNNYFINYPEQVSENLEDYINYYYQQAIKIIAEYKPAKIWLGGWSMGGNVAVKVAELLEQVGITIERQIILFDSQYIETLEGKTDKMIDEEWNAYSPKDKMYQRFINAGYTPEEYINLVDCSLSILSRIRFSREIYGILLFKCHQPIANYYCPDPANNWRSFCNKIEIIDVEANHINILIEKSHIEMVAKTLQDFFSRDLHG